MKKNRLIGLIITGVILLGYVLTSISILSRIITVTSTFADQVTKANTFASGQTISSAHVNENFDDIYNEFNGSIEGGTAGNMAADTLTEREMADEINPRVRWDEGFEDFVSTGLLGDGSENDLTSDIEAGACYVDGYRINKASATSKTYTDDKDTWCEINASGTFNYQVETLGASQPSTTADYMMLFCITAKDGKLIGVTDVRDLTPYATSVVQHYRRGLTIEEGSTADTDIVVQPGTIELGGAVYTATADSSDLDVSAESFIAGSNGTSQWIYVYCYNNSGTLAFKLGAANPPAYSDTDLNTVERPLRYHRYSSVDYRLLGCVYQDAAGDLCWGQADAEGMFVSQFDASNVCIIGGKGTGSDQTFNTVWTPKRVQVIYGVADTTPAGSDAINIYDSYKQMISDHALTARHPAVIDEPHEWETTATTAGVAKTFTAQSAGTAGSFTIHAMTDGKYFYATAYGDGN